MPIFGRSSSTTTSQTTALPASREEQALRDSTLALAREQVGGYGDLLRGTSGTLGGPDQGLLDQSTANLAQMTAGGGMTLSPQQLQFLNTLFENERTAGLDTLTRLGKEIAAQRGFALSDSPIANPLFEQGQRLALGLGTARAQTGLQYGQQAFLNNAAIQQFQNQLRQQAFANRAGLLQGGPTNAMNLQQNLFGERFAQGKTVGTSKGKSFSFDPIKDISQIAGGIAGFGAGAGGGVPAFSGSALGAPMGSGMVSTPPVY